MTTKSVRSVRRVPALLTAVMGLLGGLLVFAAPAQAAGTLKIDSVIHAFQCGGQPRGQAYCTTILGEWTDTTEAVEGQTYRLRSTPALSTANVSIIGGATGWFQISSSLPPFEDGSNPLLFEDGDEFEFVFEKYVGNELVASSEPFNFTFDYVDGPSAEQSRLVQQGIESPGGLVAGMPVTYDSLTPWQEGLVYETRVVIAADDQWASGSDDDEIYLVGGPLGAGSAGPAPVGFTPTAEHVGKYAFVSIMASNPDGSQHPRYIAWGPAPVVATADPVLTKPSPARLSSVSPQRGTLKVVWNAVSGATGYDVTATPTRGGAPVKVTVPGTSASITGLADDTTYDVTVVASDASGAVSPASDALRVTTLAKGSELAFTDVLVSHVFSWEMAWLASRGVTTGYANGNGTTRFDPSAPVLREQMAAFLYRSAGSPAVENVPARSPFSDVSTSHTFYKEIVWLSRQSITTGYTDGTFRPSQPVLREQMAVFLARYAGVENELTAPTSAQFTDVPTSLTFAKQIAWLSSTKVTTGYPDGTFRPSQPVLREQMAAFLYRFEQLPPRS